MPQTSGSRRASASTCPERRANTPRRRDGDTTRGRCPPEPPPRQSLRARVTSSWPTCSSPSSATQWRSFAASPPAAATPSARIPRSSPRPLVAAASVRCPRVGTRGRCCGRRGSMQSALLGSDRAARSYDGGESVAVAPLAAGAMIRARAWGGSSAGRASRSQCEGRGFDPLPLHHFSVPSCTRPLAGVSVPVRIRPGSSAG
jgi:hypothetical protein